MGLDGISVNQLRITQEANYSNIPTNESKKIDGLYEGQKVDPDKEKEKQNQQETFQDGYKHQDDDNESIPFDAIKYDLGDSEKYILKIDEESNNVIIIKKDTQEVLQVFSAEVLSNLTGFLQDSHGILINRKY